MTEKRISSRKPKKPAEDGIKKLLESEKTYRTLVNQSLEGIIIARGPIPRIVFANQAMAEISGYTVDELTSLTPKETRALVHPEDQAMFFKRFKDRLRGKKAPLRYDFRALRKDGQERWLEMSARPVGYLGQPAIQATFIDITRRKKAEAELRAKNEKLEEINRFLAEREVEIIELKKKLRECENKLERQPRKDNGKPLNAS